MLASIKEAGSPYPPYFYCVDRRAQYSPEEVSRFTTHEMGLRPLTDSELSLVVRDYAHELVQGRDGKSSSLAMFDTLLPPDNKVALREDSTAVILEVGGTKTRTARYQVEQGELKEIAYNEAPLPRIVFKDPSDCFRTVINLHTKILNGGGNPPDAFGVVWSFPGRSMFLDKNRGVDVVTSSDVSKNFEIPGIDQIGVGEGFLKVLNWNGYVKRIAVMNDTRAAGGVIVGTGFNILFGPYNSESCDFRGIPMPWLYKEVDRRSGKPNRYLAEKQISGLFLEPALSIAAERLVREGLLLQRLVHSKAEDISSFLDEKDMHLQAPYPSPQVYDTLRFLAQQLSFRSAQLVGTMVGTGISIFPEYYNREDQEQKVVIPAEGSVFWGVPGYQDIAQHFASEMASQPVEFVKIHHGGLRGAAQIVLGMVAVA